MLGITPQMNSMDCSRRRNNPNFGMAVKLGKSAIPVIKEQASQLVGPEKDSFFKNIMQAFQRQIDNPVNILIRKAKKRNALQAVVVDSEAGKELGAIKNQVFSQPIINKKGNLKFLDKAEKKADKLNETNNQVQELVKTIPKAMESDLRKAGDLPAPPLP